MVIAEDFSEFVPLFVKTAAIVAVVFAVEHEDVVESQRKFVGRAFLGGERGAGHLGDAVTGFSFFSGQVDLSTQERFLDAFGLECIGGFFKCFHARAGAARGCGESDRVDFLVIEKQRAFAVVFLRPVQAFDSAEAARNVGRRERLE